MPEEILRLLLGGVGWGFGLMVARQGDKGNKSLNLAMRVPDEGKLPVSWLAGNQGEYATSTEALWALRDFMLQEALGVVKITAL